LWIEGGWSSAFYELAMTCVMLPALVFGVPGAIGSSAAFSLGFLIVLIGSPLRPAEVASLLPSRLTALLNPWLVAGGVAVLAVQRSPGRTGARVLDGHRHPPRSLRAGGWSEPAPETADRDLPRRPGVTVQRVQARRGRAGLADAATGRRPGRARSGRRRPGYQA